MKCKKCDFENTETAKFCRICGNNLEETSEIICGGVKFKNRIFIILSCLILLIMSILIIGAFLLNNDKRTVSNSKLAESFLSTQELSNASKKMFTYMVQDEHQKAIELYRNRIQGNYEKESEIASACDDYYKKINDEFLSGNITQEFAILERDKLVKVAGSCHIDYDFENDTYFDDVCESKENFDVGCKNLEEEKFLTAYNCFNAVMKEDCNYQESLLKIEEVFEKYRSKTLKVGKEKADLKDYLAAHKVIVSSFDLLENDQEITEAAYNYENMYAENVINNSLEKFIVPKEDYILALEIIEDGLLDFPENDKLNDRAEYYKSFEPKRVYDMAPIRGSATEYDEEKDTYGNMHYDSFCVGYGRSWLIWHETDVTYDISDYSYDIFTATIYGRSTKTEAMYMSVQIYADDVLVYDNNDIPDNATKPFDIKVDISNASELRIVLDVYDSIGSIGYGIGMTNMELQRTKK